VDKLTILTSSKNKVASVVYRDRMGNVCKFHGRVMLVNVKLVILKSMRTKRFQMVLLDAIAFIKAQKKVNEFPSILPVVYTPISDEFKIILMNIQPPMFVPAFAVA